MIEQLHQVTKTPNPNFF